MTKKGTKKEHSEKGASRGDRPPKVLKKAYGFCMFFVNWHVYWCPTWGVKKTQKKSSFFLKNAPPKKTKKKFLATSFHIHATNYYIVGTLVISWVTKTGRMKNRVLN